VATSGHVALQECSSECGCRCKCRFEEKYLWMERPQFAVIQSQGSTWRLATLTAIPKGRFVLEIAGEVIDSADHSPNSDFTEAVLTQSPGLYVKCAGLSSLARFLAHSDRPCLSALRLRSGPDPRQTRLLLFSCQEIEKDQELTVNLEQLRA